MALRALSLCAGVGGIDLGLKLALGGGVRTVGYVEREAFAASVLVARMEDEALDRAPIWDDLSTFDGLAWRGAVDIVTAGFPCQGFSTASRGRPVARDLWPHVYRTILAVDPVWVFLENVQRAPLRRAAEALEQEGYSTAHDAFDSAELGAPHRRVRWWLLANDHTRGKSAVGVHDEVARISAAGAADWWRDDPGRLLGVDDGDAYRVDRTQACGNAVVPAGACHAFVELYRRLM